MYAIGKLKPFLTPRHRRTGLASVLALVGCLLAAPALAQVAALCGPGKACTVRALTTTQPGGGVGWCADGHAAYKWGWRTSPTQMLVSAYLGDKCTGGQADVATFSTSAFTTYNNIRITSSAGFDAPVAFASFPTAASATGRLLYDATNNRWRQSRLGGWLPLVDGVIDVQSVYVPSNAVTNNPLTQWVWTGSNADIPQLSSVFIDSVVVLTAGVGAGNITYTVYDATGAAATTAAVTIACTAAAGTVTAGTNDGTLRTFPRNMQLRVTASACGTNPVVNVGIRTSLF